MSRRARYWAWYRAQLVRLWAELVDAWRWYRGRPTGQRGKPVVGALVHMPESLPESLGWLARPPCAGPIHRAGACWCWRQSGDEG